MEQLTHGLLVEDFKQNLLNLVNQHKLDIQTKTNIMELICIQMQIASKNQTDKELEEYKKSVEAVESNNETHNEEMSK